MKIELTKSIKSNIGHKFSLMREATSEIKSKVDMHEKDLRETERNERRKNIIIYGVRGKI